MMHNEDYTKSYYKIVDNLYDFIEKENIEVSYAYKRDKEEPKLLSIEVRLDEYSLNHRNMPYPLGYTLLNNNIMLSESSKVLMMKK